MQYSSRRRFVSWLALLLFCVLCASLGLLLGVFVSEKPVAQSAVQTLTITHKQHKRIVTTTRTITRNGKTLTVPVTSTQVVNATATVPVTRTHTNTLVVNHTNTVNHTVNRTETVTVPTTIVSTVTETVTTGGSVP